MANSISYQSIASRYYYHGCIYSQPPRALRLPIRWPTLYHHITSWYYYHGGIYSQPPPYHSITSWYYYYHQDISARLAQALRLSKLPLCHLITGWYYYHGGIDSRPSRVLRLTIWWPTLYHCITSWYYYHGSIYSAIAGTSTTHKVANSVLAADT